MGLRERLYRQSGAFFVTTSTHKRSTYFTSNAEYELLERNIEFYRIREKANVFGYVLMPNHFHLIINFPEGGSISNFMRDLKRITAREFFQLHNQKSRKLWQDRFDDLGLISERVFLTKLNYIHLNPVRAGLVVNAEDWRYSSARYYLFDELGTITVTRF